MFASFLSPDTIIQSGGLAVIALVIFSECGFLVGLFLPGDTLLIPAGIWASQHPSQLNIWLLLPTVAIATIAGYQVGYKIGEQAGPKIFRRKGGLLLREDYLPRAQHFVDKHGGKSMIIARFIAVVRTLVPVIAGVGKMPKRRFFIYNLIGGILWTSVLTFGAYWVGRRVNNIDKWIAPIVLAGVIVTGLSELAFVMRSAKSRHAFSAALREELGYIFGRKS